MKYTFLPSTKIKVSKICLGTMTFGNQNSEKEGFEQMDYAIENGVNFFDTAELYPVPGTAALYAAILPVIPSKTFLFVSISIIHHCTCFKNSIKDCICFLL